MAQLMRSRFQTASILVTLSLLALLPTSIRADFVSSSLLDPATLHIGGTVPPPGSHPNQIGSSGLVNIYQNSGGASDLKKPFLLILGIPNAGNNFFSGSNPITSVTAINPFPNGTSTTGSSTLGGTNLYGGTWNTSTGFAGTMTSGGEAYSTIVGLQGPTDNSNNFVQWAAFDQTINGVTATSFGIYVFEISATLGGKGVVGVQFPTSGAGALPLGTYAIAYGQNGKHLYDTAFTQAGLTTGGHVSGTPAPPSVVLLGLGGLVVTGALIRSRRRLAVAV